MTQIVEKFSGFLWNLKFHYLGHKSLPFYPFLIPVYNFTASVSKMKCNIILVSIPT